MIFDAVCRHRIIASGGPERQAKDLDSSPQVDYRDYPITADSRRITGSGRPFTFALHRSLSLPVCSVHSSGAHTQTDMALRLQVSVTLSATLSEVQSCAGFIVERFIVVDFDYCVGYCSIVANQVLELKLQQTIIFNVI